MQSIARIACLANSFNDTYLSRVFESVKSQISGCLAISFADDFGFLIEASKTPELVERIKNNGTLTKYQRKENLLLFDHR